jgi:hypothetical protein
MRAAARPPVEYPPEILMTSAIFFYQAALIGSIWYFTSSYGWLGYMLTMMFWAAFTLFRVQTFYLKTLQTTVLLASGYIMWAPAYADLRKIADSAGVWIAAGLGIIAMALLYGGVPLAQ